MQETPEILDKKTINIHIEYTPFISFAMQQNSVKLIHSLSIANNTNEPLTDVQVRVWHDPPVISEQTLHIDRIEPSATYAINDTALTFLRTPLRQQTEREEGQLWLAVHVGGQVVLQRPYPVSVLAYNEWFGGAQFPEILAAHVLPNDPAVELILKKASDCLQKQTGNGDISGYQAQNTSRIYSQAVAIYWAIAQLGISYANPPASFEKTGQKIRTPSHLLDRKLGTCLDLAALFAACFEQAGLRPVLVLIDGHAFPGVWLKENSFNDTVIRYASSLTNRTGLGELLLMEATSVTKTPQVHFKTALDQAEMHLDKEGVFHHAIDVWKARQMGIRPLSLMDPGGASNPRAPQNGIKPENAWKEDLTPPDAINQPLEPDRRNNAADSGDGGADRLTRWKTSLLDLSLRNKLLNFRETKSVMPLLCPNIASLEDALADGAVFSVRPQRDAWDRRDPRDRSLLHEQTGRDALNAYLQDALKQHQLYTPLNEQEVQNRLKHIERGARLGLEEGGANTLFLAIGFLNWYESETSDVARRAPILLMPMGITRKSVREGFRIQQIDEESRINITLLQKLKIDFNIDIQGLDPLPEDESGLDVRRILRKFRDAIKHEPRWTIQEEACLSILTFSRFLMWYDLAKNAEILKNNEIVRHLVETPNEPFEADAIFPDPDTLDAEFPPSGTFCPLPADSSQLQGIFSAAQGRTFVLQGPPGTGKSQTITNLIAHCLTLGKRILFVAQKRAALDVVHTRLTSVGLGPFCLELHSNKTTKASFRKQILDVLNLDQDQADGSWATDTEQLDRTRTELNEYVDALHKPRAFGKSAYWTFGSLIRHQGRHRIDLALDDMAGKTADDYQQLSNAVHHISEATQITGNPSQHPLKPVRLSEWAYGIDEQVRQAVHAAEQSLLVLQERMTALIKELGLAADSLRTLPDLALMRDLTGQIEKSSLSAKGLLTEENWDKLKAQLMALCKTGQYCAETRAGLLQKYKDAFFSLDITNLAQKLETRQNAWFLKKWLLGMSINKIVRPCRRDGKKVRDFPALAADMRLAESVNRGTAELNRSGDRMSAFFGNAWNGPDSNWDELAGIIDWADGFRALLRKVPGEGMASRQKNRSQWIQHATEYRSMFCPGEPAAVKTAAFRDALDDFLEKRKDLNELLHIDPSVDWTAADAAVSVFDNASHFLRTLASSASSLREWSHYQSIRGKAITLGLTPLVEALEGGLLEPDSLTDAFEHAIAHAWAMTILPAIPALKRFLGENHNQTISRFRRLKDHVSALTREVVIRQIAGTLPRMALTDKRTPASSETGQLVRFTQGKRKTIRRIFRDCPNALARYKPCVLMSPLSVAQFIGADFPPFDIVVFDEASQMPTYEAIGAIARGKALIVVGDSRQLPPTSFFEKQKSDEDYNDDVDLPEELESILDEAETAGLRSLPLKWHYRSRHESLITFSNHKYYSGSLFTFPAALAEHPARGVQFRPVPDGVYDHGRARTNEKEAQAIVDEVVRRLRDPAERERSLGIVTFSMAQQILVEDLLEKARAEFMDIEPYFTTAEEPVFVKNLETVQGDERDVILFSICYGPDKDGKIRMHFGPLNNKGGERRLNVAITRAREQLIVFSTLRPEQIDLSRTKAIGVRHLKSFLDYAKRGAIALADTGAGASGAPDSPFEEDICNALIERGWTVDRQVGSSNFRIDLAVRDPEAPGQYLLGILCDGENYRNASTAADRDHIRQAVLERLGWRLHRIWSADWCFQKDKELLKLENAVSESKNKAPTPVMKVPEEVSEAPSEDSQPKPYASSMETPPESADDNARLPGRAEYIHYHPEPSRGRSRKNDDAVDDGIINDLVEKITQAEAPILLDALCAKVAAFCGLKRSTAKIRRAIKMAIAQLQHQERPCGDRIFIWHRDQKPEGYALFRVPSADKGIPRRIVEICPEEVANAAAQVLQMHISISREDLSRETARLFGISRLGQQVRAICNEGIDFLEVQGRCRSDGSTVTLP